MQLLDSFIKGLKIVYTLASSTQGFITPPNLLYLKGRDIPPLGLRGGKGSYSGQLNPCFVQLDVNTIA